MTDHAARARRIHDTLPVVDGHNDLPWEIRTRAGGSLITADPRRHLDGFHTDFPRMRTGGVGVQFWSMYVPAWSSSPRAATHRQIDLVEEMTALAPEWTALAGDSDAATAIRDSGRPAGMMGIECGYSIEDDLGAIAEFHRRGVRYMTLTHADTTSLSVGQYDQSMAATSAAPHAAVAAPDSGHGAAGLLAVAACSAARPGCVTANRTGSN